MLKLLFNRVKRIYQRAQLRIYSILDKAQLTKEQLDDITMKLDIVGGAIVAQAFAFATSFGSLVWLAVFYSIFLCAIIWTTTFIMKGYTR